ncbi:acyl-CoA dehydrogenase NM domain-like protein [Laetiporus sulphureus 93-53]|uniref:Acyl-CoA dehydrogenase NM domain-like protein n=1 Tax=Laetiporus sulphureus 93-53 TaxID=1314785 RepID=A0A165BX86_9APHY|nr:acyl-CoA dehydrogenase NM domain-like protein [Laetiporus sulphureus 93-53]KZT01816.1 acyl-CoA dehydrogenase NM domain-like protein [Laetiporus sulphureus 93-53]
MYLTRQLAQSALFQPYAEDLSLDERIRLSYERARQVGRLYALTAHDVLTLSPKFWDLHIDPICTMDGAMLSLLTLQYNLCAGTLAMFSGRQPHLNDVLKEVLAFNVSGQFCLTEVGHGLNVFHMETTATLLSNGEFDLHTPSESSAKFMPPTSPTGIPCIAVVFARTVVEDEDRGVKPFIVRLNDGTTMESGVICKLLPQRGGSRPLNHSMTYFNHVRLPSSALLGSIEKPADFRASFFESISRVAVGTLALGSNCLPALQVSSYIAARYSLRRMVVDRDGSQKPIMGFQTQKAPIVTVLAQSFVMQALHTKAVSIFRDVSFDFRIRHAMATILKVVMVTHAQAAQLMLGDRCGAQGLFEVNQLSAMHADLRGSAIAEGDMLVISIRLATELLLGRYAVPDTTNADSILAKHERGMFDELRGLLAKTGGHRSTGYNQLVLPECSNLVLAIGHRMAYDAAIEMEVDACLVDLYVASCVKADPAWYAEKMGLSRMDQKIMEVTAVEAVYDRLEEFLTRLDVEPYVSAPIVSQDRWTEFVGLLKTFKGEASVNVTKSTTVSA